MIADQEDDQYFLSKEFPKEWFVNQKDFQTILKNIQRLTHKKTAFEKNMELDFD